MNPNRATAVVFAMIAAILATVVVRGRGPSPLSANSASNQFSAHRAISTLAEVLGGDAPHPIGTAAHDVVRDRIVAQFRKLGYETSVQQALACNAYATCAPVANVIARLAGDARADTLVVVAHYDSVPAGAGASDDGIGVAGILEVARAIRRERFRNTILFLITDGEEDGLLGAEAFIADPMLSRGVAAVINIDNRGTSGRSFLFETSRHNRWLLPLIARGLTRPSTSSLFYNLYELLPNDTDLSVFKRAGIAGINFACIGQVAHYHTPLDNLRHVTLSTVQTHGDHILAMTRTLANTDLRQSTDEDAIFFDVLSLKVLWWPQSWTKWMAAGALLVLIFAAAIRVRDDITSAGAVTAGVMSFFLSAVAAAIFGAVAVWVASLRTPTAFWLAQPGPVVTAMWLLGVATAIVCARGFHSRAGFDGLFIGHGLCWAAMAIAVAIVLPGGSYLVVVPAMLFALCTTLRATVDLSDVASAAITSAITAVLWFPIVVTLYDVMGKPALSAIAAAVAVVSTTFTPIVAASATMRRASVAAMYTTTAACLAMQLLIPAFTPDLPRRINVEYVDDEGVPRWVVDGLSPQLRAAARFTVPPHSMAEWLSKRVRAFTASAPRLPITPPEIRIISDSQDVRPTSAGQDGLKPVPHGRDLTLQLRSARGAERIALIFHATGLARVRVNGVTPPPQPPKVRVPLASGWHEVSVRGAQQAQIEIMLQRDQPIEALVIDRSYALPQEALPLTRARDASMAVPSDAGDGTVVRRRVRL